MNLRSRFAAIAAVVAGVFGGGATPAGKTVRGIEDPGVPAPKHRPFMEQYDGRNLFRDRRRRQGRSSGKTGAASIVTGYRFRTNSIKHVY